MTKINKKDLHKKKQKRYNKTYAGKHTKRELEKRVKLARTGIIIIVLIGISQWLSIPRTVVIQGGGGAVATAKQATLQSAEGLHPKPSVDEDYEKTVENIKQEIIKQARYYGVNVETALRIAECESNFNPNIDNWEDGDASGVFQFRNKTWINYCEGDVYNYQDNIRCFMKMYPKYPYWWACS